MVTLDLSQLQTESRNGKTNNIDEVSTLEMCYIINTEDAGVPSAVRKCLPAIAAAIDATAPRIREGGRLVYVGAGTSGRLGVLDASEIQPTFSAPAGQFLGIIAGGDAAIRTAQEGAEDSVESAIADMDAVQLDPANDTLIGIAASGRTPYVLACLKYAKSVGCLTLGVACCFPSVMRQCGHVDHMISVVTGPEVVTGSTRLKAGTGTKLVLNMLSTGIMLKIGKTYGNMMVDVQSSNIKLKQRSRNIIRSINHASMDLTDDQLDQVIGSCNGNVKLALMTLMSGLDVTESSGRLQMSRGVLKSALETWEDEQSSSTPDSSQNSDQNSEVSARNHDLVICIDGGGSKCAVVVADCLGNTGRGEGGACNFADSTLDALRDVVTRTTQRAMHDYLQSTSGNPTTVPFQLGSSKASPFSAVLAGISGFDRPGASEAIKPMLMNVLGITTASSVEVMSDADLLTSVLTKYPDCQNGVVLIAGTGSVAMSFELNPESGNFVRIGRSGGWGHILGDEGSGFDIGRQGIRATLAAFEKARLAKNTGYEAAQQSPSCFHTTVMESLGVLKGWDPSLDLLSKILQSDTGEFFDMKTRIAGVARVVLDHAASDLEAAEIASTSASHLVRLLMPLLRLDHNVEADSVLVLSGGLMKCMAYRSILLGKLAAEKVYFRAVEFVEDPASAGVLSLISRKLL